MDTTRERILDPEFWQATVPSRAQWAALGFYNGWRFDLSPERFRESLDTFVLRDQYVRSFSFALPSREILDEIERHSRRLVEVGAGTGFWSMLIAARGVDIVATDAFIEGDPSPHGQPIGRHFKVHPADGPVTVAGMTDRDVLMVWPTLNDPWAARVAEAMQKDRTLFYIGEGHGGCTADDAFFEVIDTSFEEIDHDVPMVQFMGIHDELRIFKKTK